jgi:alpha-beta hydrolase superfamily lysophospholipase
LSLGTPLASLGSVVVVDTAHPRIDVLGPSESLDRVAAVALVLHGGREHSREAVRPDQLAVRRMRPFARALATAGGSQGLAVWSLQYRVRGWNGDEQSPVADATWALDQIRERLGDVPVVLVGHSMGGRTAVHVAGHQRVVAVTALAPWLPLGEPYAQVAGRSVLVVHGRRDTTTSPRGSFEWARHAATVTDRLWLVDVRHESHAMVLRFRVWHALATGFSLAALGMGPLPRVLADAPADRRREIVV